MEFFEHNLPTLGEAKQLCNFIDKPLNGSVVLLGCVTPSVSTAGISIDKKTQEANQTIHNKKNGLLVVNCGISDVVKPGDRVILKPHANEVADFSRAITSDDYYQGVTRDLINKYNNTTGLAGDHLLKKKYVVIVMHPMNFAITLSNVS